MFQALRRTLRRWQAAATDRLNAAKWSWASDSTINADLLAKGHTLRIRSTYEAANNPFVVGLMRTYSMDVVGPDGPTLRIICDDDELADAIERLWWDWTQHCDATGQMTLAEIMQQCVEMLFPAGEYLTQILDGDTAGGDSLPPLRLLTIHPRRLSDDWNPGERDGDRQRVGGITVTQNGQPIEYHIDATGDASLWTPSGRIVDIPASEMIHGFHRTEPGQVRGVPLLASVLETVSDLREYDQAVLDAAKLAAQHSAVLFTKSPEANLTNVPAGSSAPMRRGEITVMPAQWELTQMDAKQPTAQYQMLRIERQREIGLIVGMPVMIVRLDSGDHTFSSARFDAEVYRRQLRRAQRQCERNFCDRILPRLIAWARVMATTGDPRFAAFRSTAEYEAKWEWPTMPQGDPFREAQAEQLRLNAGTISQSEVCAANNRDHEQVAEQRDREQRDENRRAVERIAEMFRMIEQVNAAHPGLNLTWPQIATIGGATSAPAGYLQGTAQAALADAKTDETTSDDAQARLRRSRMNGVH